MNESRKNMSFSKAANTTLPKHLGSSIRMGNDLGSVVKPDVKQSVTPQIVVSKIPKIPERLIKTPKLATIA